MMNEVMCLYIVSLFLNGCQQEEVNPVNDQRVLKIRKYLKEIDEYGKKYVKTSGECWGDMESLMNSKKVNKFFSNLSDKDIDEIDNVFGLEFICINSLLVILLYNLIKEITALKEGIREVIVYVLIWIEDKSAGVLWYPTYNKTLLKIENVKFNKDITLEQFKNLLIEDEPQQQK